MTVSLSLPRCNSFRKRLIEKLRIGCFKYFRSVHPLLHGPVVPMPISAPFLGHVLLAVVRLAHPIGVAAASARHPSRCWRPRATRQLGVAPSSFATYFNVVAEKERAMICNDVRTQDECPL